MDAVISNHLNRRGRRKLELLFKQTPLTSNRNISYYFYGNNIIYLINNNSESFRYKIFYLSLTIRFKHEEDLIFYKGEVPEKSIFWKNGKLYSSSSTEKIIYYREDGQLKLVEFSRDYIILFDLLDNTQSKLEIIIKALKFLNSQDNKTDFKNLGNEKYLRELRDKGVFIFKDNRGKYNFIGRMVYNRFVLDHIPTENLEGIKEEVEKLIDLRDKFNPKRLITFLSSFLIWSV